MSNTIPMDCNTMETYTTNVVHNKTDHIPKRNLFFDTNLYPSIKFSNTGKYCNNLLEIVCRPKIINELKQYAPTRINVNCVPKTSVYPNPIKTIVKRPIIQRSIIFSPTRLPIT